MIKRKRLVIGVVGVGHIFPYYLKALEHVPEIIIKSVFDKKVKTELDGLHYCYDMQEMLDDPKIDAVLISTSPGTHFKLAEKVLMAGKSVILEKPPTETTEQLLKLGEIAKKHKKLMISSFHAGYCLSLQRFLEDLEVTPEGTSHPKFGMLKAISSNFFDPYVTDGKLKKGIKLGGSWMDSGPNALSVILRLVDEIHYISLAIFSVPEYSNKNCREVASTIGFGFPGGNGNIQTDWTNGKNLKVTKLSFEDGEIFINHTDECLYDGKGNVLKGFKKKGVERLTHHYIGVFKDIVKMMRDGRDNFSFASNIMTLLEFAYKKGSIKI